MSLADPGPVTDPFVIGLHQLRDVVVGQYRLWHMHAPACDMRIWHSCSLIPSSGLRSASHYVRRSQKNWTSYVVDLLFWPRLEHSPGHTPGPGFRNLWWAEGCYPPAPWRRPRLPTHLQRRVNDPSSILSMRREYGRPARRIQS